MIGDSRVDGIGSSPGADRRWTDLLARRLSTRGGQTLHVLNQGISGNRMLNDGIGAAALARFDRDILTTPGLGHVVIAVGNDLILSFAPRTEETAGFLDMFPGDPVGVDDVIAAHFQLAARARARANGAKAREQVNAWMRTSGAFDGVLDSDAVWIGPADPTRIRSDLHMGDHLHGSDAGYAALAESTDLSLFD